MLPRKSDPIFPLTVAVPVPGKEPKKVQLQCIHRRRDDLRKFVDEELPQLSDTKLIFAIAKDWSGLDAPFDETGVDDILQEYPKAAAAMWAAYVAELGPALLGN